MNAECLEAAFESPSLLAIGTENFPTSSTSQPLQAVTALYDWIVDSLRWLNLNANRLLKETEVPKNDAMEQLDIFTDGPAPPYIEKILPDADFPAGHHLQALRRLQRA